jgi:hypothetical protein
LLKKVFWGGGRRVLNHLALNSAVNIFKELAASSFAAGGASSIFLRYIGKTAHCQMVKIARQNNY